MVNLYSVPKESGQQVPRCHQRRKCLTSSAISDESVRIPSSAVPSVGDVHSGTLWKISGIDVQSGQQQVDEIVRCDGTQIPLQSAQHQQLPLLNEAQNPR